MREKLPNNNGGIENCLTCGNKLTNIRSDRIVKYCCKHCYDIRPITDEFREKISVLKKGVPSKYKGIRSVFRWCQLCGEEIIPRLDECIKRRKYCSVECRNNARKGVSLSKEWREALSQGRLNSDKCKGPNRSNWKGGSRQMEGSRKRSKRLKEAGEIDKTYLHILLKIQKNKCFYCQNEFKDKRDTCIEHLKPLANGGTNIWANLVYSCRRCNSKKRICDYVPYLLKTDKTELLNNYDQLAAITIRKRLFSHYDNKLHIKKGIKCNQNRLKSQN